MTLGLLAAALGNAATLVEEVVPPAGEIILDLSGLIMFEKWDRSDSPTLGNGWNEDVGNGCEILNEELVAPSSFGSGRQNITVPDSAMVQMNCQSGGGGNAWGSIEFRSDLLGANQDRIKVEWNEGLDRVNFATKVGGAWNDSFVAQSIGSSDVFTVRVVADDKGAFTLKGFTGAKFEHGDLQDMTSSLTQRHSGTPSEPNNDQQINFFMGGGTSNIFDNMFWCGLDIYIQGLTSGYKARIVGSDTTGSLVEEIGGEVRFFVSGTALPLNMIEVTNAGDSVIGTLSAPDGIWGGDSYSFSE